MIRETDVFRIGTINKPHGVKGEVSFTFTDDIFDRVDGEYLLLMMDGILVPFFLEEYRFKSDNVALVKLEDIDTAEQARRLTNVAVYFPKKYMDAQEEVTSWEYFTGFRVDDLRHGTLGTITAIVDPERIVRHRRRQRGRTAAASPRGVHHRPGQTSENHYSKHPRRTD